MDGDRDSAEAAEIYRLPEEEIIPLYYTVSDQGVPDQWVKVMKEAIKGAAAKFSARRMVKEYVSKFYSNVLREL